MEKDLHSTHITVAGKVYPIKLPTNEMENLPKIEKQINDCVDGYSANYRDLGKTDAISMALISYAFDLQNIKKSKDKESVLTKITEIQESLEKAV